MPRYSTVLNGQYTERSISLAYASSMLMLEPERSTVSGAMVQIRLELFYTSMQEHPFLDNHTFSKHP